MLGVELRTDPSEAPLDTATGDSLVKEVEVAEAPRSGVFYVVVTDVGGLEAFDGVEYDIRIDVFDAVCTDPYEIDDTPELAGTAIAGETTSFEEGLLRLSRANEDYFSVEMIRPGRLTARLVASRYIENLGMALLDAAGDMVTAALLLESETIGFDPRIL